MVKHGPLAEGQVFEWWKSQGPAGASTVCLTLRLPLPLPREDVRAGVLAVVARHDALRTTVGIDDSGHPRQVVHPVGERDIRFMEVPDGTPRDDEQLVAQIWHGQIDLEHDWPLWACLFLTDDRDVAELTMVFAHVVMDNAGTTVISQEITEVLLAGWEGRAHRLAPVELQLLDVVALEAAPQLLPERETAGEYWRQKLRATPNRAFASEPHTEFRLFSGTLTTPTAPATFAVAAQRFRTTPAVLYSSLITVLLASLSGIDRVCLRMHYHGRSPDVETVVGCFHRILFTTVDLADRPPLSTVFKRVAAETLRTQRLYRTGGARLMELEALEVQRRGSGFAWGSTVNFVIVDEYQDTYPRNDRYPADGLAPPDPNLQLNPAELTYGDVGMDAYLMVRLGSDGMMVQGGFNGNVLARSEMDALMRGPELLLFDLLRHGDLGFSEVAQVVKACGAPARSPGRTVGNCLVDVGQVAAVLGRHPDVVAACPVVERSPDGERLVAFVATDRPGLSPADLREFLLAQVSSTSSLVCPGHFVVCAAPDAREDLAALGRAGVEAWRDLPRVAEGAGDDRPARPPHDDRERLLHGVIITYNDLAGLSMTMSYLEAGGRLLVVPAILRRLAALGAAGLEPDDFRRPVTLAHLAARLDLAR